MDQSKIVGRIILMAGLGMAAYGGFSNQGLITAIGSFVILAGKLVDEYWDDWFGA